MSQSESRAFAMRNQLVGYLLEALEDDEAREVEAALSDPQESGKDLLRDFEKLKLALAPLARDREVMPVPTGLATRTIAFVRVQGSFDAIPHSRPMVPARDAARPARPWLDRMLLGASALAACILVLPLVYDAISDSRARRVERNLQRVAEAIHGYGEGHGFLPTPPDGGPLSRAGLYAPTLVSDRRLLTDDGALLVPDSKLARGAAFKVPTLAEVEAAVGTPQFDDLVRRMGGDFGYTLGHRCSEGRLQPNRDLRRASHPMLADAPAACGEKSENHPDGFHYILFEDGHFERRHIDALHEQGDHLYRNHRGAIAAGIDPDDAVIGCSDQQP